MDEQDQQPENPMANVFQMDQALAAEDEATRDQTAWELHVRAQRSQIAAQEALAKRLRAWAGLIETVAFALGTALAFAVVTGIIWAIHVIAGWF